MSGARFNHVVVGKADRAMGTTSRQITPQSNWCLVSQAAQSITIYRRKIFWTHTTMLGQLVPDARWLLAQQR
jgi:hypothetical protein